MATYFYECADCEIGVRVNRMIDDRNDPPTEGECAACACESGVPNWRRIMESPAVMHTAYHDGKDRGMAFNKLKEATKLEAESMNLPPSKRADHKRAIKELKKT